MKKRSKKVKRQMKAVVDAFACSQAVDSFAMAFDESKVNRVSKGEKGGGQFARKLAEGAAHRANVASDVATQSGSKRDHVSAGRMHHEAAQLYHKAGDSGAAAAHEKQRSVHFQKSKIRSPRIIQRPEGSANRTRDQLASHPMHSESDLAHLRGKGYSDAEIKAIWDRDHAYGKEPVEHKKPPNVTGYLGGGSGSPGTSMYPSEVLRAKRNKGTSLSFGTFDGCFQLSRDDAEVTPTKNPLVFWKEVAHAGTFFKGDQRIDITPRHISHWEKTHRAMSQAGLTVPVPIEHTNDPERRRGKVLEMAARPNSNGIPALYAKIKFRDEEAAKMKDSGVSIFVPKVAASGYGQTFVSPVQHVALTDYPVIPDLEPFAQALSLSLMTPDLPFPSEPQNHKITAMSTTIHRTHPLESPLVMDAASRLGARGDISLAFPPKAGDGEKEPDAGKVPDKPVDKPADPPATSAPQAPPNGATQKMTLRDIATQLGIDQSITDEQQLLMLVSNMAMQLKARAQSPLPPQGMPQNPAQPMMPPRPPMPGQPPSPMTAHQPQMHPPGAYGPPAMHTGRPPVAMSREQFLNNLDEGLTLSDIPQEIVMALSKKQMKKVLKTIKKGKKGGISGDKDIVQKLNDKSHFGTEEDTEGGDYDDTFKDEDNDAFENDDENDGRDGFSGKGKGGPGGLSMLDGKVLDAVKNARTVTIDNLFTQGLVTGAARKELITRFVDGNGVALSHHYDDGFDGTIKLLKANGRVVPAGKTGPQGAGVVALSNGDLGEAAGPLEADAQRRAAGKSNM